MCDTTGEVKMNWQTSNNSHQFCAGTECCQEDLPRTITDRDGWRERIKATHAINTTS